MMFLSPFNPINILARFIVKTSIRLFNWPKVFTLIFSGIFSILGSSISSVGAIPTLRVIWSLRRAITIGGTGALMILENNPNLNRQVVNTIIPIIKPYLNDCINNRLAFSFFHILTMFIYSMLSLTPNIFYLLRFSLGLVLSSLGILWNESLSGISSLKFIADYVISFLENKLSFSIPRLDQTIDNSPDISTIADPILKTESNNISNTSNSLLVLGLCLIGGITIFTGLVALDIYNSNITSSIPGLRYILDGFMIQRLILGIGLLLLILRN